MLTSLLGFWFKTFTFEPRYNSFPSMERTYNSASHEDQVCIQDYGPSLSLAVT